MKKEYTQEQKSEYFKSLRERWNQNKINADQDKDARIKFDAIQQEADFKISYYSFYFTLVDMQKNGYSGTPYVDCKTYIGWTKSGFKVKHGEKSKISGITWMEIKKDDNEDEFLVPKEYHLFHRSQVEPIQ